MGNYLKRFCLFTTSCFIGFAMYAQTQLGYVKTIGRPNKPGMALSGVVVRVKGLVNSVLTSEKGEFSIIIPGKKDGDEIAIINVGKNGYELKDRALLGRPLVFSTKVPLEILMIDKKQLEADRQRIEENAYRVAECNYQEKLLELEKQNKANEITAEKYRLELESLQNQYDKYISLIGEMADRYARTDYDQLDSIDREINICIENGDFDKADSLIHTIFDPNTVLERNRAAKEEIRARMEIAQQIIDKAQADRDAILRDKEHALRVATLSENLADEYLEQGDTKHALSCLQKALDIKKLIYGEQGDETKHLQQRINVIKKKENKQ